MTRELPSAKPEQRPNLTHGQVVRQYTATRRTRSGRVRVHGRPGRPLAMVSLPRVATRRTSRRNCAACRPVNGWINSSRETRRTPVAPLGRNRGARPNACFDSPLLRTATW